VLQRERLRWHGRVFVLRDDEWLRNECIVYQSYRQTKKTWKEIVEKGCHTQQVKEDVMDLSKVDGEN